MTNPLKHIIQKGEGLHTEFKAAFNQESIISLNAFANAEGGTVYIGVNDSGKAIGINVGEESIQSWINEVKSKTEPSIIPDVKEYEQGGKTVIALSIKEFPIKPVALQGRYYKRIKNSNHQMSLSEISELYLKTFNSSWDYYIDEQHSLEDISLDKVNALLQKNERHLKEEDPLRMLQKYELLRDGRLTKAAFLLFTKGFTALTGIQAGRFKSPTKIIDSVSLHSDLFSEVDDVLSFIRKHLMTEYIITGNAQREERFDYPEEAIREIVLNMIVHRDYRDSGDAIIKIYDDRIEFFNPGKLDDALTVEKLLSDIYTPKSRNKLINLMFKEIGLVEKYGSGIQRIINACFDHGKCNVSFENEQHGFKVVLSKILKKGSVEIGVVKESSVEYNKKSSVETEGIAKNSVENSEKGSVEIGVVKKSSVEILLYLKNAPKSNAVDIAQHLGLSLRAVEKQLKKLKEKGKLERIGPNKGGYWKVIS